MQLHKRKALFKKSRVNNGEREKNIQLEYFQTEVYTAITLASDPFIEYQYLKQTWMRIHALTEHTAVADQ
jgi:hypothetical protein